MDGEWLDKSRAGVLDALRYPRRWRAAPAQA